MNRRTLAIVAAALGAVGIGVAAYEMPAIRHAYERSGRIAAPLDGEPRGRWEERLALPGGRTRRATLDFDGRVLTASRPAACCDIEPSVEDTAYGVVREGAGVRMRFGPVTYVSAAGGGWSRPRKDAPQPSTLSSMEIGRIDRCTYSIVETAVGGETGRGTLRSAASGCAPPSTGPEPAR